MPRASPPARPLPATPAALPKRGFSVAQEPAFGSATGPNASLSVAQEPAFGSATGPDTPLATPAALPKTRRATEALPKTKPFGSAKVRTEGYKTPRATGATEKETLSRYSKREDKTPF